MAISGEFQHGVDEKGRLIIPASFRKHLGEVFMLQKGQEGCLFAYPMETWGKLEGKLNELSDFNLDNRNLKRRFFSAARECDVDRQGRTLIPQDFREYANLAKEAFVVGVGDRIEIWDKETWERYRVGLDEGYEATAEAIQL